MRPEPWPAVALAVAVAVAGCAAPSEGRVDDASGPEPDGAFEATFWLRPGFGLSQEPPASAWPQAMALPPGQNAYANEDLEVFRSTPIGEAAVVDSARVVTFFEVTAPVVDPFVTGSPPEGRLFVFWLGSDGVLAANGQSFSDALLVPGVVYEAVVDVPVPATGLFVGAGRALELLAIATASQQEGQLRLLVDSEDTPSRIEVFGRRVADPGLVEPESVVDETVVIPANTGLFTGATSGSFSEHRRSLALDGGQRFLRIEVRFEATTGPKADLDLWLEDATGAVLAASTTPFQSETVELWPAQMEAVAAGDYAIVVNAYSGIDTSFRLRVLVA